MDRANSAESDNCNDDEEPRNIPRGNFEIYIYKNDRRRGNQRYQTRSKCNYVGFGVVFVVFDRFAGFITFELLPYNALRGLFELNSARFSFRNGRTIY